jgi:hypothetical protein
MGTARHLFVQALPRMAFIPLGLALGSPHATILFATLLNLPVGAELLRANYFLG